MVGWGLKLKHYDSRAHAIIYYKHFVIIYQLKFKLYEDFSDDLEWTLKLNLWLRDGI